MSALFRGSSTAAFDGLYERHATSVYRYAFAVLGNHADAEDVTQTTFLNAYRSLAQRHKPRKAENWLLTIAHNQIRQHFRQRAGQAAGGRARRAARRTPSQERSEPSVADVLRALQHLPPTQRAAIVMREFEGRSYAEMAEILGVTQSALEALLFRARRSLAEQLEGAFTCGEAEQALSRKLDGRLPRSEARRLKAHLRECTACSRFDGLQRKQRTALKGLGVIPVPASIVLFRGETAAAAAGLGAGAAAAGGSTAVGAGAATGVAAGVAAKVAAATAAAAVVTGGVGLGVASTNDSAAKAERKATHAAAVDATRKRRASPPRCTRRRRSASGPAPLVPRAPGRRAATARAATAKATAREAGCSERQPDAPNGNTNAKANLNANARRSGAATKVEAAAVTAPKPKTRDTASRPRAVDPPLVRPAKPKPTRPARVKPARVRPEPVAAGRTETAGTVVKDAAGAGRHGRRASARDPKK